MLLVAACGGTRDHTPGDLVLTDSSGFEFEGDPCNLLTQAGCGAGEKCTWIHDTDGNAEVVPPVDPLGHIGCAPDGQLPNGNACTFQAAAMSGVDDCTRGNFCSSNSNDPNIRGTCQTICDNNTGGPPSCADGFACATVQGVFAADGATSTPAGICEPACNPLDDNSFLGSDAVPGKTGSACGSSNAIGCYGFPADGSGSVPPTHYLCASPAHGYSGPLETGTLVHRSPVPTNEQFVNSCAPGYALGVVFDAQGSMQVDCLAFCAPANSYAGNPGTVTSGPNGGLTTAGHSHHCDDTDARGLFESLATPAGANGEHCVFNWLFELDPVSEQLHLSPYSDTVGICIDHTKYLYDSNGDGTLGAGDAVWPACPTIPLTTTGSDDPLYAGFFGCVDHTIGNRVGSAVETAPGFARMLRPYLRFPRTLSSH